ncbi:MAG: hypothetical protein A3E79_15595 [Burkholderiales bacterium RIFCSPHIGHO2_12_FULL_61_11]|nr:MAG: hypothetical protein A3E79_15595 [Burkholderiales bacterium RIFCSPHIGHO2_12_FULL_61_11]
MSLILPSSAAPSQPVNASPKTTARSDEPEQNAPGSFADALSRSLEPAENAGETSDKAATPAPLRRQTSAQETDPQDLVNTLALSLAPMESRIAKATPTGAVGSAANSAASGAAAAPLAGLMAGPVASAGASTAGLKVSLDADPPSALALSALAPALAGVNPQDAGQATPKAQLNPVTLLASDSSTMALDHRKIAAPTSAPITASEAAPSTHADKATARLNPLADVSVDPTPAAAPAKGKVASSAAPALETAAPGNTASQAPDAGAAPLSTSAVLPGAALTAAASGPVGVAASNAPLPTITASLSPEVGSSEWGKALGQQVIQMGHAGHQVAELQLNPPGLGPLKVTLSLDDQQIQLLFVSAHSSVRAAVEAALPQLRSSLADSGINLGNTSVSADSQQQTAFSQEQSGHAGQRSYRSNAMANPQALSARPVTEPLRRSHAMSVDTYA